MRFVNLGTSELSVSRVGLGTMGLGGYFARDSSNDENVVRILQQAIASGANFIDTAEIYGDGHSEELVGTAIRSFRSQVVIATKFSPEHSDYQQVIDSAESSLARLKTETIDLYQTHWPSSRVPFGETARALQSLLAAGKVRTVGLSNASLKQIREARTFFRPEQFVSLQQQFNLADRYSESVHLPFCKEHRWTLLGYSPLLEGKITPSDSRRIELSRLADEAGLSLGQLVIAWLLRHPEVVVIPKTSSLSHLHANLAAADVTLSPALGNAVDRLYTQETVMVDPSSIQVTEATNRQVYRTIAEARENAACMSPSPTEIADELRLGETFKPIKVQRAKGSEKPFQLIEGRLRYWAWVIAFGEQTPLPCFPV